MDWATRFETVKAGEEAKKPMRNLAQLKHRLVKIWTDFEQSIVDEAIDQ